MGAHILHDHRLKDSDSPCGFCLSTGSSCSIQLTRGRGANSESIIDMQKFQCPYLWKISLKSVSSFTARQPCTNHPLLCPVCKVVVWKYNLYAHITTSHPTSDVQLYKSRWSLHENEATPMKAVFLARSRQSKKKRATTGNLVISESHSSRMALRCVYHLSSLLWRC